VELGYQNGILTTFVELSELIVQFAIISPIWLILGFLGGKLGLISQFL